MRFDDSLATVLAADTATDFGAQSAWRQLVDLAGRRRVPDLDATMAQLRALRGQVPVPVRAASARALAWGTPPLSLVALFAEDELAIAAPVLRTATLSAAEWGDLLPRLGPTTRSVLRHRRDLPPATVRALASFGAVDFVLDHDRSAAPAPAAEPVPVAEPVAEIPAPVRPPTPEPANPSLPVETPFVAVGAIARALPVVAEAMRQSAEPPRFEIADLVARIDAFRRDRPAAITAPAPAPERFQFETDAAGVVRWVEGVARGALIGLGLAHGGRQGTAQVDAAVGGALRARSAFRDVRLEVAGGSSAAGSWRLSGVPRFDRASGRFTGLAGSGRRPRREESAAPGATASEALRQLVHELRTPTNAIAGFSELIGTELLGPVAPVYRERARLIQREVGGLVAAIDDLDTAARIEGAALELSPGTLELRPLLARIVAELQPAVAERRASLSLEAAGGVLVRADDRALTRLLDRLLTTLVAMAEPGERLRAQLAGKPRSVRLHLTRPRALTLGNDEALFSIDTDTARENGPLLGVGFTLRLVRNLAAALGGTLAIAPDRLTLRLPLAETTEVGRTAAQ